MGTKKNALVPSFQDWLNIDVERGRGAKEGHNIDIEIERKCNMYLILHLYYMEHIYVPNIKMRYGFGERPYFSPIFPPYNTDAKSYLAK